MDDREAEGDQGVDYQGTGAGDPENHHEERGAEKRDGGDSQETARACAGGVNRGVRGEIQDLQGENTVGGGFAAPEGEADKRRQVENLRG